MRVFTLVGKVPFALGADELWTANLENGKDFSETEAKAIVEDFQALDTKKEKKYWYEKPVCSVKTTTKP